MYNLDYYFSSSVTVKFFNCIKEYDMSKFKISLLMFLLFFSTLGYANEKQEFDEVCKIYTEVINSDMNIETGSKYIFDNINKRIKSKEALQTHTAVMEAMGDERYNIFKGSAEYVLKNTWHCSGMKLFMEKKI